MTLTEPLVFYIQTLSCIAMTSVIWMVQLNHYPTFRYIDADRFKEFQLFHMRSITIVVAPLMILEFISGILCVMLEPSQVWYWVNLAGILVTWAATQFLSIPCHNRLISERHALTIEKLINTNWIRTVTWSLRSILLIILAFKNL